MAAADAEYILDRTEAEYDRLRKQAKLWETATLRLLKAAGATAGMRCLDAGCGPGEVMRLMGRLVGSEGHVTGLDADAGLGAHTLARLRREEGAWFDFVAADLMGEAAVPGAPFDLVFARFLLIHMTDPVATVRRLAALVRPGGTLVLMDFDTTRMACRPEHPAMTRGTEIVAQCFERSGKHADCGLRLASYLVDAGLPMPAEATADSFFRPIADRGPAIRAMLSSLAPAAASLGVAAPDEIAAIDVRIRELEAANRHFALGPLLIGTWITIP